MNRINIFIACFSFLLSPPLSAQTPSVHGISLLGDLKYPENFTHFDYVNPDAPKGGMVNLGTSGTFDTFNGFSLKGTPANGSETLHCSLLTNSADEPASFYGYLAEKIRIAADHKSVSFVLNKNAKFSDGTPVTADDVVFSFNILVKKGPPLFAQYYRDVAKAEIITPSEVKFTFSTDKNRELASILGQFPVFSKAYYQTHDFEKADLLPPVGCGPYQVKEFKAGQSVVYTRIPAWWGENIPSQKGLNNFDVRYAYYRDPGVLFEAFKAGDCDFRSEQLAKNWATGYKIPAVTDGKIILKETPHELPTGTQAFIFNTRNPIFADRSVRDALAKSFDFEWLNRTLFFDFYKRSLSYFNNSPLACSGLPKGEELAILHPYKDSLPPELFTESFKLPITKGTGHDRDLIGKANAILKKAGWVVKKGIRVNEKTGKPLTFELLLTDPALEKVALAFQRNLKALGVHMTIRTVTLSQYIEKLRNYDYDMICFSFPQSEIPGNEQREFWGSKAADIDGGYNFAGIKDPIVDNLVELVIASPDRQALVDRVHALDRVLSWGYYSIQQWYLPTSRIAYWNKFGMPEKKPKDGVGFNAWWLLDAKR
jgi:microcin C transport system substrate-binding protein